MKSARSAEVPGVAERAVLRRMLGFGLLGVTAMTALAPGIALMRTTTGHDWYAAGKLTAVDAALAVGFDRNARVVEYRKRNGRVERMSRHSMYWNGEALVARELILDTALHYALLGTGIGGAVLLTTMLGAVGRLPSDRRGGTARSEPAAHPYRLRTTQAPAWSPGVHLAGRLRVGRGRVALLVVREADLVEIAEPDDVVDIARSTQQDGAVRDGEDSWHALPAAASGDTASGPSSEGRGPHKYGRWA